MLTPAYLHHVYANFHRRQPFFGSGLEESLERIPDADLHRAVGHRTIGQLLEHMLAWRRELAHRLLQEPHDRIQMNSAEDWPAPRGKTKADYLKEFAATRKRLETAFDQFDYSALNELLHQDYDYTNMELLEGGYQHDIYHLGQINLIAALLRGQP